MNEPLFKTDILVRVADISYGGHMGNDRFLALAQEARLRWLKTLGLDESCLILMDAKLTFLKEIFWGDTLTFELKIEEVSKCGMVLLYKVIEKKSQKIASEISTKIAFFDYAKKKIAKTPEVIANLKKGAFSL